MMIKRSSIIPTLLLVGLLSFAFSSRALANLSTFYPTTGEALGTELILNPDISTITVDDTLELNLLDAEQVVAHRLAQLNVPQPYQVVRHQGQLVVTLPERADTPYVNSVIAHVGQVKFIDGGEVAPQVGQKIQTGAASTPDQAIYHTLFTGEEVLEVSSPNTGAGQIFYQVRLQAAATERFTEFAWGPSKNHICIVLDEEVISCSAMYHWEQDTLEILPHFSSGSVVSMADLAIFLESGPLPLPLEIQR